MRKCVQPGQTGSEPSPQERDSPAPPLAAVVKLQRAAGNRAFRQLLRREYGYESDISRAVALAKEATKGHHLYDREHYLNARLTDPKEPRRADQLAQLRAIERAILNARQKQWSRQPREPDVEQRIEARKEAIWAIGWKKSAKEGLAWAEDKAKTPMAREQVALVRDDMDFVKKSFKHAATRNAYALLDASWKKIEEVVGSYGLWMANGGSLAKNVAFGYMSVEEATDKWLEGARSYARFKTASGARSDLGKSVPALADLQQEHRRLVKEYEKKYSVNPLKQDPATIVGNAVEIAGEGKEPRRKALEKIAAAKARLDAAWVEAEALHPLLAAYREEDVRDLLGAGSKTDEAAVRSMIATCIDRLSNIIYAKAALQQGKVSPLQLGPIVALTRSQMLIRPGTYWGYAIEDLIKEDKGDAEFAKQVLQVVLAALSLLPGGQVFALLGVALDLYTAGTEYVQYGLDKAMAGTDLDRALALSDKTPSLAGFAFALVSAGMNLGAARAAVREAEPFAAAALKGETEAIDQLNRIGAKHGVKDLGKQVASKSKASPKPHPTPRAGGGDPPSAGKPLTEDEWLKARKPKSARPYNAKPTKEARLPPGRRKPTAQQIDEDVSDLAKRGEEYAEALRGAEKTKADLGKKVAEKTAEADKAKQAKDAAGYKKAVDERAELVEKWEDAQAEVLTQQQNIRQVRDEIDRIYKEALEDVPRLDPKVDKVFTKEKRRPNFGRDGPTNAEDVVVTNAPLRGDALNELDKLLANSKLNVQQKGNEFAALVGRHEGWTNISEIFRAQHGRIGRRWDFGNTKEITIEGRVGKLGDHKLDQLWFDLNHHGSVDLTVPALSGTAREQLARLAGEWRRWNPGKKPTIMVRVVGR